MIFYRDICTYIIYVYIDIHYKYKTRDLQFLHSRKLGVDGGDSIL